MQCLEKEAEKENTYVPATNPLYVAFMPTIGSGEDKNSQWGSYNLWGLSPHYSNSYGTKEGDHFIPFFMTLSRFTYSYYAKFFLTKPKKKNIVRKTLGLNLWHNWLLLCELG